ncbi:hypothetical protein NLX71_21680 [Paenibacillus sp. MZ04-78.2]|uniref:hypothetical protein n=1 Tax=Paenibacillus sp. MZ04-78.2 TaxID=2962034 RepID=UPI0020B8CD34|nr:hypothetical protein [Paenibacillus sp. MZ04-78.2]MCP3775885.1 hypothetical protein [Paenibacillus sp. MZ04-78.2]
MILASSPAVAAFLSCFAVFSSFAVPSLIAASDTVLFSALDGAGEACPLFAWADGAGAEPQADRG